MYLTGEMTITCTWSEKEREKKGKKEKKKKNWLTDRHMATCQGRLIKWSRRRQKLNRRAAGRAGSWPGPASPELRCNQWLLLEWPATVAFGNREPTGPEPGLSSAQLANPCLSAGKRWTWASWVGSNRYPTLQRRISVVYAAGTWFLGGWWEWRGSSASCPWLRRRELCRRLRARLCRGAEEKKRRGWRWCWC